MPATMFDVPLDGNGLPAHKYRLRHRSATYGDAPSGVAFRGGLSVHPVPPTALRLLLSTMGEFFDLERVDATEPRPAPPPADPVVSAPAVPPAGVVDSTPAAPSSPPVPVPEAPAPAPTPAMELPDDIAALRSIATARGVEFDSRIGKKKLKKLLRETLC